MKYQGFCGPTGPGPALGVSNASNRADVQRTINLYPEANDTPNAKSEASLIHTPGLTPYCTTALGPVWCLATTPNNSYALAGDGTSNGRLQLYVLAAGSASSVATVPNSTMLLSPSFVYPYLPPVMVATNNYLFVCGQRVPPCAIAASGFGVTSVTIGGSSSNWPTWATFIDGYVICGAPAFGTTFYVSNVNDPTTWTALQYGSTQDGPDQINCGIALRRELWLFGAYRTAVYYDSGSTFPFARVPGAILEIGCPAPGSVQTIGGSIFFIGTNGPSGQQPSLSIRPDSTYNVNSQIGVFMTNGYNAQRISTVAIETQMAGWNFLNNVTAYTYQENGHVFYCLNPTGDAGQSYANALVYDLSTGLWHERSSAILSNTAHPVRCVAECRDKPNQLIAGSIEYSSSSSPGAIYLMPHNVYQDNGQATTRTRIGPVVGDENEFLLHHGFELDADIYNQSAAQSFTLSYYNTGNPYLTADYSQTVTHAAGYAPPQGARFAWRRLGKSRNRAYKITTSDNLPVRLRGAFLAIESAGANRGDAQ